MPNEIKISLATKCFTYESGVKIPLKSQKHSYTKHDKNGSINGLNVQCSRFISNGIFIEMKWMENLGSRASEWAKLKGKRKNKHKIYRKKKCRDVSSNALITISVKLDFM